MTTKSRSAATLAALVAILLIASLWGWQALTAPLPTTETVAPCADTTVKAGDTLPREMVTVTVLNASGTGGLAGKTMDALVARGFAQSAADDAPAGTVATGIQIWSTDPKNPAVELVRRQFRKATVVDQSYPDAEGVVVVVGKNPTKLKANGPETIKVTASATVCTPILEE